MLKKVLIANRGEIACRVVRACQKLNMKTVAVYSEADKDAMHVQMADEAYLIGPPPVQQSYLQIEKIIQVAKDVKVDAIHPGYGLLSENTKFAKECQKEGIVFIGPSPEVIETMGDKVAARQTMKEAGLPVIPGMENGTEDVETLVRQAETIGYPVMLKAAAGGGGIGMERAANEAELRKVFEGNKKRAESFFGNGTLYLEKLIENARHIEIQILADEYGNVVHLGERDCSVQRRNQKVIEESPSPFMSEATRQKMGEAAVQAAKHMGYTNAGTMEFLVDPDENFYFLEMNTRLQVEHPVTEEVTGVDIVEWQLRIASGERIPFSQDDIAMSGHALEARIYAEDPNTFFPSPGTISALSVPEGEGLRHECGVTSGSTVTPYYDPMIAKFIVSKATRKETIAAMKTALREYRVEGIKTNIPMLLDVLSHDQFQQGKATISFVSEYLQKEKTEK